MNKTIVLLYNVSEILITPVNKATTRKSKLDKLENAIQSFLEVNISPFLISKHMFSRIIEEINHKLRKSYQNIYLVQRIPLITILMDNSFLPETKTSCTLQLNSLFHPKVTLQLYNVLS